MSEIKTSFVYMGVAAMPNCYKSSRLLFLNSVIILVQASTNSLQMGAGSRATLWVAVAWGTCKVTSSTLMPTWAGYWCCNIYWGLSMHKALSVLVCHVYCFSHNPVGRVLLLSPFTRGEAEAQRCWVTYWRSTSKPSIKLCLQSNIKLCFPGFSHYLSVGVWLRWHLNLPPE